MDIIQENASVFPNPGEIIIGPKKPARNKVAGCMGIFYGVGKGLDCSNIFGKIFEEDLHLSAKQHLLKEPGNDSWRNGEKQLVLKEWYKMNIFRIMHI